MKKFITWGNDAFLQENYADIEKVLTETFQRVAYNLEVIYEELINFNYRFKTKFNYNFERPLIKPLQIQRNYYISLMYQLSHLDLFLYRSKCFIELLALVILLGIIKQMKILCGAVQIQFKFQALMALSRRLLKQITWKHWQNIYNEDGFVSLALAADYFHKDNISGGPAYALQLTSKPSIDSQFLNEEHETTFINYLRICF